MADFTDAHYEAIQKGGSVLLPDGTFVTNEDDLKKIGGVPDPQPDPEAPKRGRAAKTEE